MTMAQQWAHEAQQKQGEKPHTLSKEYQCHVVVFDEQEAMRFPPAQEEELSLEFLLGVPKKIDCKVYPLSYAKQDQLRVFLTKEEEKGYIYKGSSP